MVELPADIEQQLRDLPESEWTTLAARVRPPDRAEALRSAVGQLVPKEQVDGLMDIINVAAFTDDAGEVNAGKLNQHVGRLFGSQQPQQQAPQWGQQSGKVPGPRPGDLGRVEAARRSANRGNKPTDRETAAPPPAISHVGGAGRAEAARRSKNRGVQR